MRGQTSRLSLKSAKEKSAEEILKSADPVSDAEALFFLSSLLSSHDKVLEAFLDSSHTPQEKEVLASSLLPSPSPLACSISSLLSSLLWSRREDMEWAADEMGKECLMEGAKKRGSLQKVRGEMESFQSLALSNPLLDRCLSDKLASSSKRTDLCQKILPEAFEPESKAFCKRCAQKEGGRYSEKLLKETEKITSFMGEVGIEVRCASPLSEAQEKSLKDAYFKRMKKPVHIRQILDPSLVGGFSVRCGAEVTDMSAEAQLRALSGTMKKKMAFSIKI